MNRFSKIALTFMGALFVSIFVANLEVKAQPIVDIIPISVKIAGWKFVDGTWKYYDDNGVAKTGWVSDGGYWYYLQSNGAMRTGWQLDNGKWYYMDSSGAMQVGWVNSNNKWYYMELSGEMHVGWIQLNNTWYYMNPTGEMYIGWLDLNNVWYYFKNSGAMSIGAFRDDGSLYRFNTNGSLATVTIDADETQLGEYFVEPYTDTEQYILDYINSARNNNSTEVIITDMVLSKLAKQRLSAARRYGYYTQDSSITGLGTLKDQLKSMNYMSTRAARETYIRTDNLEGAISESNSVISSAINSGYKRIGIAVEVTQNDYYIIINIVN
jgi:FOG: Glucan-binding domain (YG repeat)